MTSPNGGFHPPLMKLDFIDGTIPCRRADKNVSNEGDKCRQGYCPQSIFHVHTSFQDVHENKKNTGILLPVFRLLPYVQPEGIHLGGLGISEHPEMLS